ncbi:hypothetical protein K0017_08505 [Staphylococcus massiliensis]|nr:hypothetical protein [Staphylococcus massiliensis]
MMKNKYHANGDIVLSDKSEKFLRELRVELMYRGKKDETIFEIEDELRDHLYHAEQNGESVDNITGGSPKAYIDSISKEIPFDKSLYKILGLAVIMVIMLTVLPELLDSTFVVTLGGIFFNTIFFLIGLAILLAFIKLFAIKFGEIKKRMYAYFLLVGAISFGCHLLGAFLARKFPIMTVYKPSERASFIIGLCLLTIMVIFLVLTKQWIYLVLIAIVTAPFFITSVFIDGNGKDTTFMVVSFFIFIAFQWILIGYFIYQQVKEYKADKRRKAELNKED